MTVLTCRYLPLEKCPKANDDSSRLSKQEEAVQTEMEKYMYIHPALRPLKSIERGAALKDVTVEGSDSKEEVPISLKNE